MPTYRRRSIFRSMRARSSDTARRAFTSLLKGTAVRCGCRSTPRTASTARRATSRTRRRTSTGSHPRAEEAPIILTCRLIGGSFVAAAALASAAPAEARNAATDNPAWTYVEARAAAMGGEHRRSAELLAALAEMNANDVTINRKALAEAISAGNMELALRLARRIPLAKLPVDGRMLLIAEELKRG